MTDSDVQLAAGPSLPAELYLPTDVAQIFVEESNEGFWAACRRRELTVQRCRACGHYQHPPRVGCAVCQSDDLYWAPVPGTGTVYSFTVVRHGIGRLAERVPFNIVVVELDESGTRLVSNLVDVPAAEVAIGQRVTVVWEVGPEDLVIPRFRLVEAAT